MVVRINNGDVIIYNAIVSVIIAVVIVNNSVAIIYNGIVNVDIAFVSVHFNNVNNAILVFNGNIFPIGTKNIFFDNIFTVKAFKKESQFISNEYLLMLYFHKNGI